MAQHTEISVYGIRMLKMAALYLALGLALGLGMAVSHQFQLRPVHTHINLLGWASMGLTGVVYCILPQVGSNRFAKWHFWLHNIGLPVMMVGLGAYSLGRTQMEPVIGLGSVILVAGLGLFTVNLFRNLRESRPAAAALQSATAPTRA